MQLCRNVPKLRTISYNSISHSASTTKQHQTSNIRRVQIVHRKCVILPRKWWSKHQCDNIPYYVCRKQHHHTFLCMERWLLDISNWHQEQHQQHQPTNNSSSKLKCFRVRRNNWKNSRKKYGQRHCCSLHLYLFKTPKELKIGSSHHYHSRIYVYFVCTYIYLTWYNKSFLW